MNFSQLNHTDKDIVCFFDVSNYVWVGIYAFIIVLGFANNVVLLRVLLKGKRSASQVLGLNASVVNIIFILSMPFEIYTMLSPQVNSINKISELCISLNLFACPFLLASMCVERYLAVARPVYYLRLNRMEHRAAWSVLVWLLTFVMAGLIFHFQPKLMLETLSVLSCIFFAVILACVSGIVRALCQRNPAQSSTDMNPMKRKALVNVLVVVVPTVLTYTPGLVLLLYDEWGRLTCSMKSSLVGAPRLGVFIAPMFYMSRAKTMWCRRRQGNSGDHKITEEL